MSNWRQALQVDKDQLIEDLFELEHKQWEEWSKNVAEDIEDEDRLSRWKKNWVDYDKLPEKVKDQDREWAEKALSIVEDNLDIKLAWYSSVTQEQARLMPGKRVMVNSYWIKNKPGKILQYLPKTHHFWVYMDEPYKTMGGTESRYHKCNAGNCTLIKEEV
jgi:hypothetical protein